MRNSPRSFATASRVMEDPADWTAICAPATRAPLASWTSPRSAPLGFWPYPARASNIAPRKTKAILPSKFAATCLVCMVDISYNAKGFARERKRGHEIIVCGWLLPEVVEDALWWLIWRERTSAPHELNFLSGHYARDALQVVDDLNLAPIVKQTFHAVRDASADLNDQPAIGL